ncbi:E3 ubiquitin-protein ligase NEURL1 [Oryzias melastigma]|uniref:E3 ubiquitin-protein ligase NEURL1 n=1 Tax=Oryzias melastigma TaxID=30732 RepID=A0A834BUI8_ORYME|nr:E3 ubiquitin-protein ligase NEURL1 [Oryzias melastigma]
MGSQTTKITYYGTLPGEPQQDKNSSKRCIHPLENVSGPLQFHPRTKGSQILMDLSQRTVKRQSSFCNGITFSNRPIAVYEQVRLKITKKQYCWSGALRLGFTSTDPSRLQPENLPKYSCPDLVSHSGFWAKALPEELSEEGNIISFWVDKNGRVFYKLNDSNSTLFFNGVRICEPLWALIDVYGLTKEIQLLDTEMVAVNCMRPRSFSLERRTPTQRKSHDPRLSISMCDLSLRDMHLDDEDEEEEQPFSPTSCHVPQNSQNLQQCLLLPGQLDSDVHFHDVHGIHVTKLDKHTVARLNHRGDERTLVFTSRPLYCSESLYMKVKVGLPHARCLSYGVTSCDPATLRPSDLPCNPESLVDRKEFWAVGWVTVPLQSGDILGFVVNPAGEVMMSHNGVRTGMQLCVDNSRPLSMFFGLHSTATQLMILGSSMHSNLRGSSAPSSPTCELNAPPMLCNQNANLNNPQNMNLNARLNSNQHAFFPSSPGTIPISPSSSAPESPTPPSSPVLLADDCAICYENAVDTVLYACGHMCLCYTCGLKLKMTNAICPICRRTIKDIIKIYRNA